MPRVYKRKTTRQSWSPERMERAVEAVVTREMGYKKAAEQFGLPQTTLERYVAKKKRDAANFKVDKTSGKFQCVFTELQERELEDYLLSMEARLFGLTIKDLRKLAYQLAVLNNCAERFNSEKGLAGTDWVEGFLKRHPKISLRKPEATSGARAMGFNKIAVSQFFTLLEETVDKYKLTGDRIYNCDETGITVNPKGHSKILSSKGKRQVGILTSAERGQTVTVEVCFSAAGAYMPPLLVFPRKRMQKEFELGLPPGSVVKLGDSGWMNSVIFMDWLKDFVKFSGATREKPVLLLLDGHASHTKSLDLINYARENGIILLCFPPHCSHRLQPLDVAFMKPLSTFYEHETRAWLRNNPGKVITLFQMSTLFGGAFINAATMKTAISAFKKTGIWPVDQQVFTEADYLPSDTTDIPREANPVEENCIALQQRSITPLEQPHCFRDRTPPPHCSRDLTPPPHCPRDPDIPSAPIRIKNPSMHFVNATPADILPIPKVAISSKRVSRKRGKTAILTSTPYKNELEETINQRNLKEQKKNLVKRKIGGVEKSTGIKAKKKKSVQTKKSRSQKELNESSDTSEDDDTPCLYCNDLYSNSTSREGWIRCRLCFKWAHNACAGIDSEDDDIEFECEVCK